MRRGKDKMIKGDRRRIKPICEAHKEYAPESFGKPLYVCYHCETAWYEWKKRKGVVEK